MRSHLFLLTSGFVLSATLYLSAQPEAAAPALDPVTANTAVLQLEKQQAALLANQVQIDVRLAALAEDLRLARIFVSRGGSN